MAGPIHWFSFWRCFALRLGCRRGGVRFGCAIPSRRLGGHKPHRYINARTRKQPMHPSEDPRTDNEQTRPTETLGGTWPQVKAQTGRHAHTTHRPRRWAYMRLNGYPAGPASTTHRPRSWDGAAASEDTTRARKAQLTEQNVEKHACWWVPSPANKHNPTTKMLGRRAFK